MCSMQKRVSGLLLGNSVGTPEQKIWLQKILGNTNVSLTAVKCFQMFSCWWTADAVVTPAVCNLYISTDCFF